MGSSVKVWGLKEAHRIPRGMYLNVSPNHIFPCNDVRQTVEQIQSNGYAFRDGDIFETSKHKITFKIVSI